MLAQYLYECEGEIEHYTYEIKGTKEQEEFAKWLWVITKDLSDAFFHNGKIKDNLIDAGYDDEEIEKIFNVYPDLVSKDVITAYDQCISKLREMGMEAKWIDIDCNEPDVWTSTGVY